MHGRLFDSWFPAEVVSRAPTSPEVEPCRRQCPVASSSRRPVVLTAGSGLEAWPSPGSSAVLGIPPAPRLFNGRLGSDACVASVSPALIVGLSTFARGGRGEVRSNPTRPLDARV